MAMGSEKEDKVANTEDLVKWLKDRRITEVECMVSDMVGIARGKIIPTRKFISGLNDRSLKLPESIFGQTVTGDYVDSDFLGDIEPDIILDPDPGTVRVVPWYDEPTAQILCDANYRDGTPVPIAPRNVLKRVLALFEEKGWVPVVAPEIEFYLAAKNIDPDYPLEPPVGANGRQETARQSYGIDAVNEFDPIFEDMYDFCEAQDLDIDTLIHESGAAQVEINFDHGDPLEIADQAFSIQAHHAAGGAAPRHLRDLHGEALRGRAWKRHAYSSVDRECGDGRQLSSPPSRAGTRSSSSPISQDCRNICPTRWH